MKNLIWFVVAGFAGAACSATAEGAAVGDLTHQRLTQLAEDIVYTSARLYPSEATARGLTQYDGDLETPSEKERADYIARLSAWQHQLAGIVGGRPEALALVDRDDARLIAAQLAQRLNALRIYRQDRKDYSWGANTVVNAIFTQLQFLPVAGRDGATAATVDRAWSDIVSRLSKSPAFIDAAQRMVTHPGHLFGMVGSEELAGAASLFNGPLTDAATAHYGAGSAAQQEFLRARDAALAAIAATKGYIDAHVAAWPENFAIGRRAFERMLQEEQLLPYASADLERIGQELLARGWADEAWLTALAEHQHLPFGPASGGGMAPAGPALIDFYRDRIAQLREFVTTHDVITVPAWLGEMQVEATPEFMQPVSPGASMIPPRLFAAAGTGYYFITPPVSLEEAAAKLDINEDFDRDRILSTAAHEAMPGHFLQLSIARRHPDFVRRIQDSTAFAEGWAFYGEAMFVRLGLFGDHLDGPLHAARWERVRGARVIADVRLAAGEWSLAQAAEFYASQTTFSPAAATAAIAGIATGPGYVTGYAAGRLQIDQLLGEYWQKMGGRGSLHDFHDRLLSYGTTPLAIVGPELLADLDKPVSAVRAAANY